jgi:integrase
VARNVAQLADPPTPKRADMRTWTAGELRRFLEHVEGERLAALWMLAASTGMRRGEVLGLRWVDVDLDLARVAVRQTLVLAGRQVVTSEPKTSRGRQSIALDPRTVAQLREWRAAQVAERLAWGPSWAANPHTGPPSTATTRPSASACRPSSSTSASPPTVPRHKQPFVDPASASA